MPLYTVDSLLAGDHIEEGLHLGNVEVLLNGEVVADCFEADTEAGYVLTYTRDENENLRHNGVDLYIEAKYGDVVVRAKPTDDPDKGAPLPKNKY